MEYTLAGDEALGYITDRNKGLDISWYSQKWGWGGDVSGSNGVIPHGLKSPDYIDAKLPGQVPHLQPQA